jgi:integrase
VKSLRRRGNNEGCIRRRSDGTYEAIYTVGYDSNGKGIRKSLYDKNKDKLIHKLNLALSLLHTGDNIQDTKTTLLTWINDWLHTYKKPNIAETTYETHYSVIKNYIKKSSVASMELPKIKRHHIQELYNTMRNVPHMAKRAHVILKESLNEAVENRLIKRSPLANFKAPRTSKADIRIFTLQEQERFIKSLDGCTRRVMFLLALQTGLRIGELCGLKWSDIDLDRRSLAVKRSIKRVKVKFEDGAKNTTKILERQPKTATGKRTIPLMASAVTALQQHKIECKDATNAQYVFMSKTGKHVEPRNVVRTFNSVLKKAGLPRINFHALRHTFVSRLLEAGENIKTISELIGHTDVAFTLNTYAHILPDQKQSAVDKIDNLFSEQK